MPSVPMPPPARASRPPSGTVARIAAGLVGLSLSAGALVGCPAKEVIIDITRQGIGYVINSCGMDCESDCCHVDAGELPTEANQVQVELVLVTAGSQSDYTGARLRARSPCMRLPLGCDFTNTTGYGGSLADCLAVQLNDLIAESIPEGLGFDGLDDPDDVLVVLAFYSLTESAPGSDPARQCVPSDLFACAGLTEGLDERYDITCASCNGSRRQDDPTSSATVAPCVGDCFIENCHALLVAQGG